MTLTRNTFWKHFYSNTGACEVSIESLQYNRKHIYAYGMQAQMRCMECMTRKHEMYLSIWIYINTPTLLQTHMQVSYIHVARHDIYFFYLQYSAQSTKYIDHD